MRDVIEDGVSNAINTANFPFAIWKNMFESNSVIGDEIRYVFDRQRKENKMGNTLDRPTLLMNKTFVRNTQTTEEQITAGTQYKAHDLGGAEVAASAKLKKKGGHMHTGNNMKKAMKDGGSTSSDGNIIKDL